MYTIITLMPCTIAYKLEYERKARSIYTELRLYLQSSCREYLQMIAVITQLLIIAAALLGHPCAMAW